jgi:phospholipid/cholesterol/gamma-HCH transport system permease protein
MLRLESVVTPAIPDPTRPARAAEAVGALGSGLLEVAEVVGGMGLLFGRIVRRLFPPRFDGLELLKNLYKMAFKSLPIVVITALFTGAIMVIQAAPIVQRLGAEGLVGWAAGFGTLREIAPLLTALMISGRVGANNTAELGTMVVTEQLDALRVLAIDPISFLLLPRFLGIVMTLFMMTLFADMLALIGATFASQILIHVTATSFYHGLTAGLLNFADVANGLIKSVVFGLMIALASCHFGMSTKGGAPGVGRSVNATVVASAAGIFILDYLVSFLLG